MSTTPFAGPYPTTIAHILVHHITSTPVNSRKPNTNLKVLRRRPTRQQGLSLEKLGHAIEYLVDSQLYLNPGATPKSEVEATQILMRLSREVFAECREAAPATRNLPRLLRLFTPPHAA